MDTQPLTAYFDVIRAEIARSSRAAQDYENLVRTWDALCRVPARRRWWCRSNCARTTCSTYQRRQLWQYVRSLRHALEEQRHAHPPLAQEPQSLPGKTLAPFRFTV